MINMRNEKQRENYHRTSCRQCGVLGSENGHTGAVEYITLEDAPGWELAHVRCFKCGDYFVGNEPCEECMGWKEPKASRHLIEVDLFCHCEEEE